jgi:hypothetical protein
LSTADLAAIEGDDWTGTLEYRDYQTNAPVTLRAEASFALTGADTLVFENRYPDEPQANATTPVKFDLEAQTFMGAPIRDLSRPDAETVRFSTLQRGDSGETDAVQRDTYTLSPDRVVILRTVGESEAETDQFRNRFTFAR